MKLKGRDLGRTTFSVMAISALLAVGVVCGGGAIAQSTNGAKSAEPAQQLSIGVVDFESLLKTHRDYENLQQLDEQIRLLREELQFLPLEDQRRLVDSSQDKMRSEVNKAQKEVQAEYDRINKELAGLSAGMGKQLEVEGRQLQEHYRKVLEERLKNISPDAIEPPTDAKTELDNYMRDMAQVREQRLVGKRLELERAMASRLETERSRSDATLANYDNEIMAANQEKRINLQLRLQTVTDPEEEASIQQELRQLGEEEARQKEAKAEELRSEFEQKMASEKAKLEQELAVYSKNLDAEARAQFESKRSKVLGQVVPVDIEHNRHLANEQIDNVRNIVNAEMQAKQREMQAKMKQRAEDAQAKLQAKQAAVQKRLLKLQDQLNDMVQKSYANVSDDTRKKMDDIEAKIKELQKQRDELHKTMVASLSEVVGKVAEKQHIDTVVGACIVNVSCVDLTDLSMVALKQAQ